ncbi:DinB family protein [Flexivirga caeni]|uniref:DinB family protein n=1 Tax=Flexivirga caeni TaxID=2294115 RepID=A0A3M9M371_9MICO|nr:DinB family protein [Flexivirga caeni]RNI19647.1 DinB family protein [Flexivirga caeni]
MSSIWCASVRQGLDEVVELLARVVRDCPEELWRVPMWWVDPAEIIGETRDVEGRLVSEPAEREALVQKWSTPWSVAWHTLEVLDYDLAGELEAWAPPAPFTGSPHWRTFAGLREPWSKIEIGQYAEYCRRRVQDTLADLTEEQAAAPLPPGHRYGGRPYASIVTSLVGHTTAHATQIRQFVTASTPAHPTN